MAIGPTRPSTLAEDAEGRKRQPIASGVLRYFPDALVAIAEVSYKGSAEQHNPGQPIHWDRSKSSDEEDALVRHLMCAGTLDVDGKRHTAKVAWRALAMLQKEIEGEREGVVVAEVFGTNTYPELRAHSEKINVSEALRYSSAKRYTRYGVSCCSVKKDGTYDCSLPVGHAGPHCDTAYTPSQPEREWD